MKEHSLAIRLTEPVVFLRGGASPRVPRRRQHQNTEGPDVEAQVGERHNHHNHPDSGNPFHNTFFPIPSTSNSSPARTRPSSRDRSNARSPGVEQPSQGDPLEAAGAGVAAGNSGRAEHPPAVVRGLLTMTLTKPTRIRKIDLKFKGASRSEWPDGIGPRRIEMADEVELVNQEYTFFDASQHAPEFERPDRRARSVAPRSRRAPSTSRERGRNPTRSTSVMPARTSSIGPVYGGRDTHIRSQASSTHSSEEPQLPELGASVSHSSQDSDHHHHQLQTQSDHTRHGTAESSQQASPQQVTQSLPGSPQPNSGPPSLGPTPSLSRRLNRSTGESSGSSPSIAQVPEDGVLQMRSSHHLSRPPSRQPSSGLINELTSEPFPAESAPPPPPPPVVAPPPISPPPPAGDHRTRQSSRRRRSNHSARRPSITYRNSSSPDSFRNRSVTPTARRPSTEFNGTRGRSTDGHSVHARFSFASLGDALRGKSRTRTISPRRSPRPSIHDDEPGKKTSAARSQSRGRGRNKGLKALRDALVAGLGDDHRSVSFDEDDDEHNLALEDGSDEEGEARPTRESASGKGWREFRPGTYTWPIFIPLSTQLPPSIHCNFGQTYYRLKAKIRRPGALTTNISTETNVELVAIPGDDDTEESESIVVDRMWETQLHYNISILQKSFPAGAHLPISIRLQPLTKMKVYRLSVAIDEKATYYAHDRKMHRQEPAKRFVLAKYSYPDESQPLLPILSEDPDVLSKHPLSKWFINPTSCDNTTPSCLDPYGPWDIESAIDIPADHRLRFTTTNPKANLSVTHCVRVILRVERGDDEHLDREGKRKRFDIIVEAQVNLLSALSASAILPPYSWQPPTVSTAAAAAAGPSRPTVSGFDTSTALTLAMAAGQHQGPNADNHILESLQETQEFIEGRHAPPTYNYSLNHPETRYEPESPRGRSRSLPRSRVATP